MSLGIGAIVAFTACTTATRTHHAAVTYSHERVKRYVLVSKIASATKCFLGSVPATLFINQQRRTSSAGAQHERPKAVGRDRYRTCVDGAEVRTRSTTRLRRAYTTRYCCYGTMHCKTTRNLTRIAGGRSLARRSLLTEWHPSRRQDSSRQRTCIGWTDARGLSTTIPQSKPLY